MNERNAFSLPGIPMLLVLLVAWLALGGWFLLGLGEAPPQPVTIIPTVLAFVLLMFLNKGFFQVQPNQGQVMQLFGRYSGTARDEGLRWTNPFYAKRMVTLRIRNFESSKLKVNDNDGNPIEIAAVVVWQVVDTAEAVFCVDDYENFVQIQSESALRQMAQSYPYDSRDTGGANRCAAISATRSTFRICATRSVTRTRRQRQGHRSVSAISPMRRKSRPGGRCSASRPARSSWRARASSKARSAWWSRWRSPEPFGARGVVEPRPTNWRAAMSSSNLLSGAVRRTRHASPVVNAGTLYTG